MEKTNVWGIKSLLLAASAVLLSIVFLTAISQAATGINQQVSFQGKLVNTNGTNLPDGTYNLQFKIYQDGTGCVASGTPPCGGTLKWTESRLVSATQGVTVTAGTFQVNLGSITAFGGSVDWNQDSLWLSMNVGGTATSPTWDGEMTPFIRLTAVPYALNAGSVGGLTASQLVQLTPSVQQTGSIDVSGNIKTGGTLQATTIDAATSGVLTIGSTNTTGITLSQNVTLTSSKTLTIGGQQVFSGTGILQSAAASGSYTGITGIGTVTAGTWNATAIGAGYGGTGITSYTIGDLLYASGTTTLSKLSSVASGSCLKSNGTSTAPSWGSCAAGATPTLQSAYEGGGTITHTPASGITFTSGATAPTADQFVVDNTSSAGVLNNDVDGINVKYKGGAAAVEAAGMRIDYQPGSTSGGTWSGLRIVANATGPVAGVNAYGIKLEGPSTPGAGTEEGIYIGSGWDIGLDIASGGIQMAAQTTDPATPAAGQLRLYAKTIAGRTLPKWIGPSGVDTPFQASFGFNRIAMASPNGGTATTTHMSAYGFTLAGAGTFTAPALATTNLKSSVRKARIATAATINTVAYSNAGALFAWRGNAAGVGGFYYTTRFGFGTLQTVSRVFVGLTDTLVPTSVDPTTNTTPGKMGIAINANSGNLKWANNITGTAPTLTDLGANFPVNTTDLYELAIFSPPNGSSITYRVKNLSTGNATADTTVSTNIPANTTFLSPLAWAGTTAAASVAVESGGWYLESDN